MKKIAYLLAAVCMLCLLLAACGDDTDPQATVAPNPCEAGHTYAETVVSPTETTDGYTLFQCTVCGTSYKNHYIAAANASGLAYDVIDEAGKTCRITGIGISQATALKLPEALGGYTVTEIAANAFANCKQLTELTIPASVQRIGDGIMTGCTNLKTVYSNSPYSPMIGNSYLGASVERLILGGIAVPENVADSCSNLREVVIMEGVKSIGTYAFFACTSLESLTFPRSITAVGEDAFEDCVNLGRIYLTDLAAWRGVEFASEASNPFWAGCGDLYLNGNRLTELSFPQGVTRIENWFWSCGSIERIVLHGEVDSLAEYAFAGCRNLREVVISEGLQRLGSGAFRNCVSLTQIQLPNSLTRIGNYAFSGCAMLPKITIPNGVTEMGENSFQGCERLTEIQLSGALTYVGNNLFEECRSLKSVVIHEGVASIGAFAFTNCTSLGSVVLPTSVTLLGHNLFIGCDALTAIYYAGTHDEWAAINKAPVNSKLFSVDVYAYSETQPTGAGNYWHYAEGIPTAW